MITNLKDFKNSKINENHDIKPSIDFKQHNTNDEISKDKECYDVAMFAKSFDMSKSDTIGLIKNIFVDPSQVPDNISVVFVQNNLDKIISILNYIPDSEYTDNPLTFTKEMEENDLPFECVVYVPDNKKIAKLSEFLNLKIKKENFKSFYNNGIFFINSLNNLNENNKNIVISILNENNAKNINKQLKWKRKL